MAQSMDHLLAGRYQLRSLIGQGGMAEVHLGFDTRLSRIVAIKMLRLDLAKDSMFQRRFRREAQAAASLNHPNIVAVYDTGEETVTVPDGNSVSVPFIVMEYVEGHTVKDLLSDGTPVPINEAVEIISGVLSALEYSHAAGLVHRDIKPGNIMLTNTGKVKVMDFGIARAMTDSQATMTQTNAVVGTAQYLSPEQARGEQVDARSDLYSTGVVLFELLTGQPPFTGDSAVAVAYQHVSATPPVPSTITPDISEALDRVVMKALAKDRHSRYATAAEMRTDLLRATHGGHVTAPATSVWDSEPTRTMAVAPPPMPPLRSTYAGAPSPMDTMAGTNASMMAVADQEQPSSRKKPLVITAVVVVLVVIAAIVGFVYSHRGSEQVPVPTTLVGMSQEDAKNALAQAGLVMSVDQQGHPSDTVPVGNVESANPTPGTLVDKGSSVTVFLSTGPQSVTVPNNLLGMSPQQAKAAVEAAGLVWEQAADPVASDTVEEGKIAQVNPASGASVSKGDTVTGYVSSGPDQLTVPDVTGMTQDQARAALTSAGLSVGNVTTVDDASQAKDHVVSTDPKASTEVKKGDSITLNLSSGNATIPDTLPGMPQADAVKTLQDLGLSVTVVQRPSNDVAQGLVIGTTPDTGQMVSQGQSITLYVSEGPSTPAQQPSAKPTDSANNTSK